MTSLQPQAFSAPRPMPPAPRPAIRAGGAAAPMPSSIPPTMSPTAASRASASGLHAFFDVVASFLRGLAAWIGNLFRWPPAASAELLAATPVPQPSLPPVAGPVPSLPGASVSPLDAAWVPLRMLSNEAGTLTAGVGLTAIADQTAVAGRVDATLGQARVQAIAAHTSSATLTETVASARVQHPDLQAEATLRERNGQFSAEGALTAQVNEATIRGSVRHAEGEGTVGTLSLASRNVQAAIAGLHHGDRQALSGQVAAQIGPDGLLQASGSYEKTSDTKRAVLAASYTDATTEAAVRYLRENDVQTLGGSLDKRFAHSTLGVGGEVLSGPGGEGGRLYGRWKTDAIGERAFGYQIRGEVEAGTMKAPGQDWNTYASGRIVGEKENASFFVGLEHQQGPVFDQPQTRVSAGVQIRF